MSHESGRQNIHGRQASELVFCIPSIRTEDEKAHHPYYLGESAIFLAQTSEIAWISTNHGKRKRHFARHVSCGRREQRLIRRKRRQFSTRLSPCATIAMRDYRHTKLSPRATMSYAAGASSPKSHPLRQNRLNRVKDKTKKARPSMRTSFLGTLTALAESENGAQACLSKRVLILDILSGHKRHC